MAREKLKKPKSKLRELIESLLIAVLAAFFIRAFFIQAFKIPTGSMEDTLLEGDFLFVNKFIYGAKVPFTDWHLLKLRDPKQGDVVVFKYPVNRKLDYIKRVIAVGGQTVEIKDKVVYVDSIPFKNAPHTKFIQNTVLAKGLPEYEIYPPRQKWNKDNYGPFKIPEGYLFCMGDNRDNSLDSRYWGTVPRSDVIGEALIIYWSWDLTMPYYKFFTKVRWSRVADVIR